MPLYSPRRRALLAALGAALGSPRIAAQPLSPAASADATSFAQVGPGYRLQFPRDHGSHPQFRIEWWYATGWLTDAAGKDLGFQITFFRARPRQQPANPSRFAPEHILIAHAAIADPAVGGLIHTQRAARSAFDLAGAATSNTRVWIDDWQLQRTDGVYHAHIAAPELAMTLQLVPAQPPLLQGNAGYSRKGPRAESASYYYSLPHLAVSGSLRTGKIMRPVQGRAWLDHEWSSSYLDADAAGWDWAGINLHDGGALMAFRMRGKAGGTLWHGGSLRQADGRTRTLEKNEIRFTPLRHWSSPRTGTPYPVAFRLQAGGLDLMLEPLMNDQENDTRATTGAIYWEGAVRAMRDGQEIGRGYLELTGYQQPLAL